MGISDRKPISEPSCLRPLRVNRYRNAMSALGPVCLRTQTAHAAGTSQKGHVRSSALFNDLVRTRNEIRWNRKTQCISRLQVDVSLVSIGLFKWQIGSLCSANYFINVYCALPCYCKKIGPKAHQAARDNSFPKPMVAPSIGIGLRLPIWASLRTAWNKPVVRH